MPNYSENEWTEAFKDRDYKKQAPSYIYKGEFDLKKGEILKYESKNAKNVITNFPTPYFWRAPTDNDFGSNMPTKLGIWKEASKNPSIVNVIVDEKTKEGVLVKVTYKL